MPNWFLCFIGVLLNYFAFPSGGPHFGLLSLISLIPLIKIVDKNSIFRAFMWVYLSFTIIFVSILWLNPLEETRKYIGFNVLLLLVFIYLIMPLLISFVLVSSLKLACKLNLIVRAFVASFIWAFFEFIILHKTIGFPITISLALYSYPKFMQVVKYVSAYGISFIIIFINMILYEIVLRRSWRDSLTTIVLLLLLFYVSGLFINQTKDKKRKCIKVKIVQPNISWAEATYSSRLKTLQNKILSKLIYLSKSGEDADLIIWPEFTLSRYLIQESCLLKRIVGAIDDPIIMGTLYYNWDTCRPMNAIALIEGKEIIAVYKKNKLVPFFESWNYSSANQSGEFLLRDKIKIKPLICYESLFTNGVKKEADLLVIFSNDAWFGGTRWPFLHAAFSVFRAIESNIYVIHINNNGPSLIVDNNGKIISSAIVGESGILMEKIYY